MWYALCIISVAMYKNFRSFIGIDPEAFSSVTNMTCSPKTEVITTGITTVMRFD